ncbi:MAG TPA: response regulator [Thermodesulfovibrionales bacterium]|nr:response regulator [Thermodesulfovibrionales bacterium]
MVERSMARDDWRKAGILVVEDDEVNRKLFGSLLREKGYNVFEASDGEEAIALIQNEAPALVLMDIFLPGVSGPDVLSICRRKGLLDGTKVYALTGTESNDISGAGFDGIIKKPIKVLDFLNVIEEILKGSEG